MPEVKELFNNNSTFPNLIYDSEWLNVSSSSILFFTAYSDVDFNIKIKWAVDDSYFAIGLSTIPILANNSHTLMTSVKARFAQFSVELSSVPALLQTQGFFFTQSDILTLLENTGGTSLIYDGSSNPLLLKGIDAGTNISLIDNGTSITISTTGLTQIWQQINNIISPISNTGASLLVGNTNLSIANGVTSSSIIASSNSNINNINAKRSSIISAITCNMNNTSTTENCILSGQNNRLNAIFGIYSSGIIGGKDSYLDTTSVLPNVNEIYYSYLLGGDNNRITSNDGQVSSCCIIGGYNNEIKDRVERCLILGGEDNLIASSINRFGADVIIMGGVSNRVHDTLVSNKGAIYHSGILFGENNTINLSHPSIVSPAIRNSCIISSEGSTLNTQCENSLIIGGDSHTLGNNGPGSSLLRSICVGGSNGNVLHDDCFLFTEGQSFSTTINRRFYCKTRNGAVFYTNNPASIGVILNGGSSSWASVCDMSVKENLVEMDYDDVLSRIDMLPVYQFNYIGNPIQQINYCPCAQDYHAQFPSDPLPGGAPSKDPTVIECMDLLGIAISAIKSLSNTNKQQSLQIDDLLSRVSILEGLAGLL